MDFTNTWDEASPPGTEFARNIDDHMRKSKVDVRERGGVEHITYANEGTNLDVWEHKPGQCKVAYVGTKLSFPSAGKKGALAIATDENNRVYHDDGTAWIAHHSHKWIQVQADNVVGCSGAAYVDLPGMSIDIIPKSSIQVMFSGNYYCYHNSSGGTGTIYTACRLVVNNTIFPVGTLKEYSFPSLSIVNLDVIGYLSIPITLHTFLTLQEGVSHNIKIQVAQGSYTSSASYRGRILSVVEI